MDEQRETDEDLLRVDNLSETGEENLTVILREMSNNMKTLGESIKRLHEPESGVLGHESIENVAESALKKRQKLSKEDTPGPESGHCSDSEALLGAGKSSEDNSAKDKFLKNLSKSSEDKDDTSEPVEDKLESIITKRWHQKLTDKQLKDTLEKYTKPENCKTLLAPCVNKEIWVKL